MDISELPNRPLGLHDIKQFQEDHFFTPLFFLPDFDSNNDIIVVATTRDSVHRHFGFNPSVKEWVEVGAIEIEGSLGESNAMAFSLFAEDTDWVDEHYDRDGVAIIEDASSFE